MAQSLSVHLIEWLASQCRLARIKDQKMSKELDTKTESPKESRNLMDDGGGNRGGGGHTRRLASVPADLPKIIAKIRENSISKDSRDEDRN